MTELDLCKMIRSYILRIVTECMCYDWDNGFIISQIKSIESKIKKHKGFTFLTFKSLTEAELRELGFELFDEESGLMLVPLYLYPYIKDGAKFTSINGGDVVYVQGKTDTDNRFGMCSFGVTVAKLLTVNQES